MTLEEPAAHLIRQHCILAHPEEACGLLVGPSLPGGFPDRITQAHRSRNLSPDPLRGFLIDPNVQLRLQHELRNSGLEVVGVYHSHPEGPARPSSRDREEAWPWFIYLVVEAFAGGTGGVAAFRFLEGDFQPIPLEIEE